MRKYISKVLKTNSYKISTILIIREIWDMDSREMTQQVRLQYWAGILRERQASGLSIRKWCQEQGIVEKTYHYWQHKLRNTVCQELASAGQAPRGWAICETSKSESTWNSISIKIGKSHVTADSNTDPELLSKVCRVLMSLC